LYWQIQRLDGNWSSNWLDGRASRRWLDDRRSRRRRLDGKGACLESIQTCLESGRFGIGRVEQRNLVDRATRLSRQASVERGAGLQEASLDTPPPHPELEALPLI
jgi:hypothetical protein